MKTPSTLPGRAFALVALLLSIAGSTRAQITESPYTVQPGRVLVEMDGLSLAFDRAEPAGNKYTAVGVASTIVSAGLTRSLDVQVGLDLFHRETFEIGGVRDSHSGRGDMTLRMKWTFWRNEKLGAALAIIPHVKIPSSTGGVGTDALEGGFIVPWSMSLGGVVSAGAMFHWDVVRNDAKNGYDARWTASGFVQRELALGIAVYGEAQLAAASTGLSDWTGTIGAGATWQLTQRLQLDYEMLRGVNRGATDWTHVFRVNWEW